jgi:hypothetical protein
MQNNKRYWLRGGITLASIHLLIGVIMLFIYFSSADPSGEGIMFFMFLAVPDLPIVLLMKFLPSPGSAFAEVGYLILFGTLQWFLIGSIIGYLYGKIKNRNKV